MAKKVNIELWLNDSQRIDDISVGRALGEAIMNNSIVYQEAGINKEEATLRSKTKEVIELLCTLAHELAHLLEFDHTPAHKELEARITSIFMRRLQKDGYISEEAEEKELPRKIKIITE